jgi:predicted Zn-dependent protease
MTEKSQNEVLKEKALEAAKERASAALDKYWPDIWKTKNRVEKEGKETINVGVKVELTKKGGTAMDVGAEVGWTESHKGKVVSTKVSTEPDLFDEPVDVPPEGSDLMEPEAKEKTDGINV